VRQNSTTETKTKNDLENSLSTWFGNARDRGDESRKAQGRARPRSLDGAADGFNADLGNDVIAEPQE
jgi:hypothetical protein